MLEEPRGWGDSHGWWEAAGGGRGGVLLGPLLVRCDGAVVPVTAGKQRVLLAALLLSANQAVSLDELDAALWGEAPSASARATLQNYVKRLRQALAGTGPRISARSA
jgi:DNA-binding SARP family transcriptional activator